MALTTSAGATMNPTARQYYDMMLVEANRALYIYEQFGSPRPLKKNQGDTINFRTRTAFPVITAPLVETATPAARTYSNGVITATIAGYGDVAGVSDLLDMTATDPVMNEIVLEQSKQMALSRDTIIRDQIVPAMATVRRATAAGTLGTGALATSVAVVDQDMLDQMVTILENLNAEKVTEIIAPGTGYGSTAVGSSYWAVTHPSVARFIKNLPGFNHVHNYAGRLNVLNGEIGSLENGLRVIATTNAWNSGGIYSIAFFGKDSFAVTGLDGNSAGTYLAPFGSGDDVLHQRQKAGWKMYLVSKILNDSNCANLTVTIA